MRKWRNSFSAIGSQGRSVEDNRLESNPGKGDRLKTRHCLQMVREFVSLDNGSVEDLVVNATFWMKGVPSDSLYMFPVDRKVIEQALWQDVATLLAIQASSYVQEAAAH